MSIREQVLITRVRDGCRMPTRSHAGDAGWDLFSASDHVIQPGERTAIPTGIALAMPPGLVGLVHARSGRALRDGFALVNSPGVVDSGYRGELQVIAINLDPQVTIEIVAGDRVAQLLFAYVPDVDFLEIEELPGSGRGDAGFGSSGQ